MSAGGEGNPERYNSLSVTTGYRPIKSSNKIYDDFLVEFVNNRKTENRKCLKCDHIVKSVNGGTSGMHNHIKKCLGRAGDRTLDIGQSQLNYNISPRNTSKRGLSKIVRLVYSYYKTNKEEDFAEIFRDTGYARVNYDVINGELERQYHILVSRIKSDVAKRDPKGLLVLSLDKWTSSDNKKFIGFHLYMNGLTYCLGLVHYVGFCGSEEKIVHIRRLFKNFDLNGNRTFRQKKIRDVSAIFFAEMSAAMFLPKRLLPKRPEFLSSTPRICHHFL